MVGWILQIILAPLPDTGPDQNAGPVLASGIRSPHVALGIVPNGKDLEAWGEAVIAGD